MDFSIWFTRVVSPWWDNLLVNQNKGEVTFYPWTHSSESSTFLSFFGVNERCGFAYESRLPQSFTNLSILSLIAQPTVSVPHPLTPQRHVTRTSESIRSAYSRSLGVVSWHGYQSLWDDTWIFTQIPYLEYNWQEWCYFIFIIFILFSFSFLFTFYFLF